VNVDVGRLTVASLEVAAGDPEANRVVYGVVIALVVIGLVLIAIAVWVFRQTRVDRELLAPLERMSDRSWNKRDPATQRRMLDEVRPDDAVPLHWAASEPEPDEEFDELRPVSSFDDLKDPEPAETEAVEADEPDEPVETAGDAEPEPEPEPEEPVEAAGDAEPEPEPEEEVAEPEEPDDVEDAEDAEAAEEPDDADAESWPAPAVPPGSMPASDDAARVDQ
jgi:FtsZ-interacting cell division protein ZipA